MTKRRSLISNPPAIEMELLIYTCEFCNDHDRETDERICLHYPAETPSLWCTECLFFDGRVRPLTCISRERFNSMGSADSAARDGKDQSNG